MPDKLIIIGLTKLQRIKYATYIENVEAIKLNLKNNTASTQLAKTYKNYNDNFPLFDLFQINSIPHIINGIELDYQDKQNILLGKQEELKCYKKGLETFTLSDNNTLEYWNFKNTPVSTHEITTADYLIYNTAAAKLVEEQSQENKVKVIPLSIEQKTQYIEHFEAKRYNILGPGIPKLTQEQLQSIPDFIDGKPLNEANKNALMFGQFSAFNDDKIYTINSENSLTRTYEYQEVSEHFGTYYKRSVSLVNDYDCLPNKNIKMDYKNNNDQSEVQEPQASYENANINDEHEGYKMELPLFDKNSNTESYLLSQGELFRITAIRDEEKIYFQNVEDKNQNITHSKYIKDFVNKEWDYYPNISENNLLRILETKNLLSLKSIMMETKEEKFKNETISNTTKYIEVCKSLSEEYVEILKKTDDEKESNELFPRFEDKVYNAFRELGMINEDDDFRLYLSSDILKPGYQEFQLKTHEVTFKNTNIMSKNEDLEKAKKMEVVGNERPLRVNDPISLQHEGQTLIGKVLEFKDNGDVSLAISNSRDIKDLTVNEKVKLEPMFTLSKDEKMIYLKFTYDEALAALNKNSDIKLDKNSNEKSPIFNLMVGNKTDVISFEKKIDDKMALVQGRLELRRKAGTGEAYVHGEVKHKELNLNLPVYGKVFSENQQETLRSHKDLGLVEGFQNKDGKEYALWVSLDDKLNKIVTAPQNSININQIFGVKTTDEQRESLKRGNETKIEIKGKEYLFKASAATTKGDGLTSKLVTMEKSESLKEEQKKSESKGIKR